MSKYANAGALRTPVRFVRVTRETDSEGYPVETRENVFGEGQVVYCEWVNAHGTETFTAMQLQLKDPATLTLRYSPLITPQQIVYKSNDDEPYEVISVDNVEEKGEWLEVKVQRKVAAR